MLSTVLTLWLSGYEAVKLGLDANQDDGQNTRAGALQHLRGLIASQILPNALYKPQALLLLQFVDTSITAPAVCIVHAGRGRMA